ncbi:MAG: hypothetical protein HQL15_01695 [Candidatus Omnitrophica bacterium]|nr:hypothetical protein [Candidatus Omnitrophota bacterium]
MPTKNVAKIILVVVILVFLTAISTLACVLTQPKYLANTALFFLNKGSSGLVFKEITIEKVHWYAWDRVSLTQLRIQCQIKGVSYLVSTEVVETRYFKEGPDGSWFVRIKGLDVVSDQLKLLHADAQIKTRFESLRYLNSQITLSASVIDWNRYIIRDIVAQMDYQKGFLVLINGQGNLYGGSMLFRGAAIDHKDLSYYLNIQLKGIDSAIIAEGRPVFEQLTAVVDGDMNMKNLRNQGLLVEAHLAAPAGGSMKASLLRYLAQYVPQRKQVEDLIRKDADVTLSKAQARIISITPEKISSEIILNTSSLNLNLDVKFDINVEGGISGLMGYLHQ